MVVITKIDACPQHVLKQTRHGVVKALRGAGKEPCMVKTEEQVVGVIQDCLTTRKVAPVLLVSSVDGQVRSFCPSPRACWVEEPPLFHGPELQPVPPRAWRPLHRALC